MAVTGINYNEGKKRDLGYESVYVHHSNGEKVFASGNFVKDWFDMRKYIIQESSETEFHFSNSSTVGHFIKDGAPYDSAWLVIENDKPSLVYEYLDEHIEFFVPKGTQPTWLELKEMCK